MLAWWWSAHVTPVRRRWPRSVVVLITVSAFGYTSVGCVSEAYTIRKDELVRQAQLPPELRGHRVHVVQGLGSRRGDAVPPSYTTPEPPPPPPVMEPPPEMPPAEDAPGNDGGHVHIDVHGDLDLPVPRHAVGSELRGRGTAPGARAYGGRAPVAGVRGSTAVAPAVRGSSGSSGGGSSSGSFMPNLGRGGGGGGGGGGNGGGEALIIIAVVAVAIAVVAAVALIASEGVRFEGEADIDPRQPLYLEYDGGRRITTTLIDLTPEDAALASGASVKDDEVYGLRQLRRGPLDRRGGAFKLDLGTTAFGLGGDTVTGPAAHIQIGGFPTQRFGLMADVAVSGGSVTSTSLGPLRTVTRHSLSLEAQAFPLALGRFHGGMFAKGGVGIAGGGPNGLEYGPLVGGGLLFELGLTSRLALVARAAASATKLQTSGWSTAGTITGGVAIY
jgi:hypothetical protein